MATIVLVPISHIAGESIRAVRDTISRERPDCVAVELDAGRYQALLQQAASPRGLWKQIGISAFLILSVMRWLQQSLGKRTGILPGTEMLAAVEAGQQQGARIAFIDTPIALTLQGMQRIPFREKARLLWLLLKGLAWDPVAGRQHIDLQSVPPQELIDQALAVLQKECPQLYRVLVDERNSHMAGNLRRLSARYQKIVAVIGAGHRRGIEAGLQTRGG